MVQNVAEHASSTNCNLCPFCVDLPKPKSAFDAAQPIGEGNAIITPALGMMLPGYFLAVSKEHNTSFAQLPKSELEEVDLSLRALEKSLSPLFGEYIRVESGSDNSASLGGSGSCIDHAHQHLVPATDVGSHMLSLLPWEQLDTYEDITQYAGKPYIYLGQAGLHHIVPEPNLPGQWMRRQLADIRGLSTWDWGIDPMQDNLEETITKLRGHDILSTTVEIASGLLARTTI